VIGQGLALGPLAQAILTNVENHYAAAPPGTLPLPERRVIVAGNPLLVAWDCEQVAVGLSSIGRGADPAIPLTIDQTGNCVGCQMRHAVMTVQIVRCIPGPDDNGAAPTADAITTSGLQMLTDAGLLSQALLESAAQLRLGVPLGVDVQAGTIDPLGPEGNLSAVQGTIILSTGVLA
jgi:hypothetical protein